jgi:hypothetical protein
MVAVNLGSRFVFTFKKEDCCECELKTLAERFLSVWALHSAMTSDVTNSRIGIFPQRSRDAFRETDGRGRCINEVKHIDIAFNY